MPHVIYYSYARVAQRISEVLQVPEPTISAVRNAVMLQRKGGRYSGFGRGIPQPVVVVQRGSITRTYFNGYQIEAWLKEHPWRQRKPTYRTRRMFQDLWRSGRREEAVRLARSQGISWQMLTDWRNRTDQTSVSMSTTYREFQRVARTARRRYSLPPKD